MLDPKIQMFGQKGKLVAADEYEASEWRKIGVRRLMRATNLTQKAIYSILSGRGVRKQTMSVFRTGLSSVEPRTRANSGDADISFRHLI